MATTNPPWACQGRTDHPAVLVRMAQAGLSTGPVVVGSTSPQGGVNPYFGGRLNVTGQASMNVQVDTGLVFIPNSTAWNGMYAGHNDTTLTVAIPAASSTQWRQDYIAAVVTDPGDNTANWTIINVEGTFSSSAPGALPSLPNNAVPLATVAVVPNMIVTNGAGTVTDARVYQPLPGPWRTTSANRPPTTAPGGSLWFESDTQLFGVLANGQYNYPLLGPAAPDTWHDLRPCSSGFNGSNTNFYPPQYRKTPDGLYVEVFGSVTVPSSSNSVNIFTSPVPSAYRPNNIVGIPSGTTDPAHFCMLFALQNGHFQFEGNLSAGDLAFFFGRYPLDSTGVIQS